MTVMDVELAPAGISSAERVALQQKQLAGLAHVFEAADLVRLYAGEARNFAFSPDDKSLHFMADARREVARDAPYAPPAYDNLMCFFKAAHAAPMGWVAAPRQVAEPFGGMHPLARSELVQFLESHPQGCAFSFHMTGSRSSIVVYPGAQAGPA